MTPRPAEPLGHLITRLDGSGFSHVGIATTEAGTGAADARIACAAQSFLRPRWWSWDLWGVRSDTYAAYWDKHQAVHRLRVRPGVDRGDAVRWARDLSRQDDGETDDGVYSVAKVVMVAVALATHDRTLFADPARAAEIRALALEAAQAWAAESQVRAFYCAEFVARAYGWRFDVASLDPGHAPALGTGARLAALPGAAPGDPFDEGRDGLLRAALLAIARVDAPRGTWPSLDALWDALDDHEPDVLAAIATDAVRGVRAWMLGWWHRGAGPTTVAGRLAPRARASSSGDGGVAGFAAGAPDGGRSLLPAAVVTPRMLLDAPWTEDTTELVVPPSDPRLSAGAGR